MTDGSIQSPAPCTDPGSSALVLFGVGQGQANGTTWEWSGDGWSQRAVTGPPGDRTFEAMASRGCSVVLFGGFSDTGPMNDTWEWDAGSWTQRPVPGPSARYGAAMAELGDRVFQFGGEDADLNALGGPPARANCGMASAGSMVVLFGGDGTTVETSAGPTSLSDTWTFDGAVWTAQPVVGPGPRSDPAMATFRGPAVLFGGYDNPSGPLYFDTWQWDGTAWTQLAQIGPPVLWSAMAAR